MSNVEMHTVLKCFLYVLLELIGSKAIAHSATQSDVTEIGAGGFGRTIHSVNIYALIANSFSTL